LRDADLCCRGDRDGPGHGHDLFQTAALCAPGFIAFGADSLTTGWFGDRWSRRHMMVIFFFGIGLSMISVR
jgi:MFS family permease